MRALALCAISVAACTPAATPIPRPISKMVVAPMPIAVVEAPATTFHDLVACVSRVLIDELVHPLGSTGPMSIGVTVSAASEHGNAADRLGCTGKLSPDD